MSQVELADLVSAVPEGRAWVRLLIDRSATRPTVRYGHVMVGSRPGTWHGESWRYRSATFLSTEITVHTLLRAMSDDADGLIQLDDVELTVPRVQRAVHVSHRPSFELHDRNRAEKPTYAYSIARDAGGTTTSTAGHIDYLVGPDSPSFTDIDAAYRGFFLGQYEVFANETIPSELFEIRVADDRAWLGPIHISASELTVEVCGSNASGTTLEYFSPQRRERYSVSGPGELTIALPEGLASSNAWLWLTEGNDWRDFRALTAPHASEAQLGLAQVTREQTSRDEQAMIEAVVFGGEGPFVEFKGQIPESTPRTASMFKTVAAFANGDGGTVVVGVDRDELTVVGIGSGTDKNAARDRIGQLIRTRVLPTPPFEIKDHVVNDKTVLFVEVARGAARPYGVITDLSHRDRPEFYVRRGASTYPAQPNDINEIVHQEVMTAATNGAPAMWSR